MSFNIKPFRMLIVTLPLTVLTASFNGKYLLLLHGFNKKKDVRPEEIITFSAHTHFLKGRSLAS